MEDVEKSHINEKQIQRVDMVDVTEKRSWKIVTNIAAGICMVSVIIIGAIFA